LAGLRVATSAWCGPVGRLTALHDWHIHGLDVNRGYDVQALRGRSSAARRPAPAQARR